MSQTNALPPLRRLPSRWLGWVVEESAKEVPCAWLLKRDLFLED